MGWASGSSLMEQVIKAARKRMSDRARKNFYEHVIDAFQDHDCDTLDECRGLDPMFDAALGPEDEE